MELSYRSEARGRKDSIVKANSDGKRGQLKNKTLN